MADDPKKDNPKGLIDSAIDRTKAYLEKTLKDMPYSSAAAKERMKRNLNPEDDAPVTQKTSQYKQFLHEKSAGGAMTDNYEDWKKLG